MSPAASGDADIVLCMAIEPGYSGLEFMEETYDRVRRLRLALANNIHIQVERRRRPTRTSSRSTTAARRSSSPATAIFGREDLPRSYVASFKRWREP